MRYRVTLDGQELELDLERQAGDRYVARLRQTGDGRELEVVVLGDKPSLAVLIDGRVVELVPLGPGHASARGTRASARLDEARTRGTSAMQTGSRGSLKAPMPGRIVKVMLSVGDEVQAGTAALVIEAMKMENELAAPKGGTVTQVLVKAGDTVERGALLVVVE